MLKARPIGLRWDLAFPVLIAILLDMGTGLRVTNTSKNGKLRGR
jgi:hypothetical protein